MLVDGQRNQNSNAQQAIAEAAKSLKLQGLPSTPEMVKEARVMAATMLTRYGKKDVIFAPRFLGCGIVRECEGDFLKGTTLVEVKSGYRPFRHRRYYAVRDSSRETQRRWDLLSPNEDRFSRPRTRRWMLPSGR